MKTIIECIPNFSEGKDQDKIMQVTEAIASEKGVLVLNTDTSAGANRTVITFAGDPDSVVKAAFKAIGAAADLIDMSCHHGVHPRIGATDVCPLVPISNITLKEVSVLAHVLARKVGMELQIPVIMYEHSASADHRRNLAHIRRGEYEGMATKIRKKMWKPDYGPEEMPLKHGVTVIGARPFLLAYNVHLDTTDVKIATQIARLIRTSDLNYCYNNIPNHTLPGVKAIGWFIEDYGHTQVSCNIVDTEAAGMHDVYDACEELSHYLDCAVIGSEIIGMTPEHCLIESGIYYGADNIENAVEKAVEAMKLDAKTPFIKSEKIIEKALRSRHCM